MSDIFDGVGDLLGAVGNAENALGIVSSNDPNNEISIVVGAQGQKISGWTRVKITRSIERIPNVFELEATERYPGANSKVTVAPGAACQVFIGTNLIITGYIDVIMPSFNAESHTIRITGRGKCQDLVDCSAQYPHGQLAASSALLLADKLVQPFGISVSQRIVGFSPPLNIPQFNIIYGESPADILERICRFSGLLYYEDTMGNLVLANAGDESAASGFVEGINVQSGSARFSMDQRFYKYYAAVQSVSTWEDVGDAGITPYSTLDEEVPRQNREKIFVVESPTYVITPQGVDPKQALNMAQLRILWEKARRYGRSFELEVITDNWRDSAKNLWMPNTLVPLNIPSLKVVNKIYNIGEVTFERSEEGGTTARLILMPKEAFFVQPSLPIQVPANELNNQNLNVPGGNQNPAAPGAQIPDESPAASSARKPISASNISAIQSLFGGEE